MKFVIYGRLDGLNTLVLNNRTNRYKGAREKAEQQAICFAAIKAAKMKPVKKYPVMVAIKWIEPTARRDPDNIATAKKYIFDALQQAGILRNDSMREICALQDAFEVDRKNPRIEVNIIE